MPNDPISNFLKSIVIDPFIVQHRGYTLGKVVNLASGIAAAGFGLFNSYGYALGAAKAVGSTAVGLAGFPAIALVGGLACGLLGLNVSQQIIQNGFYQGTKNVLKNGLTLGLAGAGAYMGAGILGGLEATLAYGLTGVKAAGLLSVGLGGIIGAVTAGYFGSKLINKIPEHLGLGVVLGGAAITVGVPALGLGLSALGFAAVSAGVIGGISFLAKNFINARNNNQGLVNSLGSGLSSVKQAANDYILSPIKNIALFIGGSVGTIMSGGIGMTTGASIAGYLGAIAGPVPLAASLIGLGLGLYAGKKVFFEAIPLWWEVSKDRNARRENAFEPEDFQSRRGPSYEEPKEEKKYAPVFHNNMYDSSKKLDDNNARWR